MGHPIPLKARTLAGLLLAASLGCSAPTSDAASPASDAAAPARKSSNVTPVGKQCSREWRQFIIHMTFAQVAAGLQATLKIQDLAGTCKAITFDLTGDEPLQLSCQGHDFTIRPSAGSWTDVYDSPNPCEAVAVKAVPTPD